jgi:hypothetical protein
VETPNATIPDVSHKAHSLLAVPDHEPVLVHVADARRERKSFVSITDTDTVFLATVKAGSTRKEDGDL